MTSTLPTLYAKASNGKIKVYQVSTVYYPENPDGGAEIHVVHGYIDGKKQDDVTTIREGKNIGKANETTVHQQAINEAQSIWNKAKDKKYVESLEELETTTKVLPMLAHKYQERKHKIKWPCFTQPKLNGVRCMAEKKNGEIILHSRGGKTYKNELFPEIVGCLKRIMADGSYKDGELFNEGINFQEICSSVKKEGPHTHKIQYWIYDTPHKTQTFTERFYRNLPALTAAINGEGGHGFLIPVSTAHVMNESEFMAMHKDYTSKGYEGTILRNEDGLYSFDHRSNDLQKYKDFLDAEFKIVDVVAAETGREEGAAICRCEVDVQLDIDGPSVKRTFDVRLKGSMESRREMFANRASIIGKNLTVRYQNLSVDGIPIFPVGVEIRDYE